MMEGGAVFQNMMKGIKEYAAGLKDDPDYAVDAEVLDRAADAVLEFAASYMRYFTEGKLGLIPLTSVNFLCCMSEAAMGQLMLEQGVIAREKLASAEEGSRDWNFYKGKIASSKFFCRNILTNVFSRQESLKLEDTSALDIPEEAFLIQ